MMHKNARQRMIITISAALAIVTILVISIMLGSDKNATIPVSSSTKIVIDSKDTSVFITTEERVQESLKSMKAAMLSTSRPEAKVSCRSACPLGRELNPSQYQPHPAIS